MNEVVITGMGAVSPFGFGVEELWKSLLECKNGISLLDSTKYTGDIVNIAGKLPFVQSKKNLNIDPSLFSSIPEDPSVESFMVAVYEALTQANFDPRKCDNPDRIGLFIADRVLNPAENLELYIPYLQHAFDNDNNDEQNLYEVLANNRIPSSRSYDEDVTINHFAARRYTITGPQLSIANACASGNSSLIEGAQKIKNDEVDMVIAGGAYNYDLASMIGFTRLGALSTNPDPETASCPFDANRDGFVMSAGCGILILESLTHAKKRNVPILGFISGFGNYTEAYRSTDPNPNAVSCAATIQAALDTANLNPSQIDYINAHGTSTKMNDLCESNAIKQVFNEYAYDIPISSTKSMIGHTILAAGALEAIISIKSIQDNIVHPTKNWRNRDPNCDLDFVPDKYRRLNIKHVLSNSFGFGGINTSIIFSEPY